MLRYAFLCMYLFFTSHVFNNLQNQNLSLSSSCIMQLPSPPCPTASIKMPSKYGGYCRDSRRFYLHTMHHRCRFKVMFQHSTHHMTSSKKVQYLYQLIKYLFSSFLLSLLTVHIFLLLCKTISLPIHSTFFRFYWWCWSFEPDISDILLWPLCILHHQQYYHYHLLLYF